MFISLFCHQIFDTSKFTLLYKIFKTAKLVIPDLIILNNTNTELLAVNCPQNNELDVLTFNIMAKELTYFI